MVLSDEDKGITILDQNENKIEMNDNGIVIDSKSNLKLKAANSVSIEGATISVDGFESITNTSGTISIIGNESTSISGSAECNFSSDGETSIKGALVMIN